MLISQKAYVFTLSQSSVFKETVRSSTSRPAKAFSPITVTLSGMLRIRLRLLLESVAKAPVPMVVRVLGKMNSVTVLFSANAFSPISVTPSGMVSSVASPV